jgi:outer membrane lipoprotein-sorting protein
VPGEANMERVQSLCGWVLAIVCLASLGAVQAPADSSSDAALEKILGQMDSTAEKFHTAEASVVWDQFQKVVDEHEEQKGKVYFRRAGNEIQMVADITDPDQKYVLFNGAKVQVYQPKIDQVTVYNTGKNRDAFESFLVLGFGGRGHDMLKSFDVKYLGSETVDTVEAAKLDLVPKTANVRNNVDHIVLWIDPARGVSVQQQFFFGKSGDYRLARYSGIKLNEKIPDSVFKLKTTGKTKIVSPQG